VIQAVLAAVDTQQLPVVLNAELVAVDRASGNRLRSWQHVAGAQQQPQLLLLLSSRLLLSRLMRQQAVVQGAPKGQLLLQDCRQQGAAVGVAGRCNSRSSGGSWLQLPAAACSSGIDNRGHCRQQL